MPSDGERAEQIAALKELLGAPDRSTAESRRLIRELTRASPVPVRVKETPLSLSAGGYYQNAEDDHHIGLHPSLATLPEVLAHEIGHATHAKDSIIGRLTQSTPSRLAHTLAPFLSMAAGAAAGHYLDTPLKHAVGPVTGLALSAPVLYDEHEAWRRAKELLEAHKAGKITLTRAEETKLRALLTYWATPAVSALYGLAASELMDRPAVYRFMSKLSSYTKPELRERIKSRVMASGDGGKPGQWSARKAQLVAQKYEAAGGGYSGKKTEGQRSLSKWTDQKWTTSDGKPAERKGGTTRYLPEKAWDKLSPGERAATNAKKREGSRKGEQFVANTEAAAEARKEAMETPTHPASTNTSPRAPGPGAPAKPPQIRPGAPPISVAPPPSEIGKTVMAAFMQRVLTRFPAQSMVGALEQDFSQRKGHL